MMQYRIFLEGVHRYFSKYYTTLDLYDRRKMFFPFLFHIFSYLVGICDDIICTVIAGFVYVYAT